VVDANSEVAQMIQQYEGIGWHCDPDKPQELAALIDAICKIDLSLNIGKARTLMEGQYDEAPAIVKYIESLKIVLGASN
jgi:uncharacterized protein YqgV (UPF0045/DUF77 family)